MRKAFFRSLLVAGLRASRDLEQGGSCSCVHCEGFCSCDSNTGSDGGSYEEYRHIQRNWQQYLKRQESED